VGPQPVPAKRNGHGLRHHDRSSHSGPDGHWPIQPSAPDGGAVEANLSSVGSWQQ